MMNARISKIEQQAQEKDHYIQKPTVITNEFIAEEIWDRKNPPKYLRYNFATKTFDEQQQISLGEVNSKGQNIIYTPVFNDSLKKGLVIVPSGYTETSFQGIFGEIDKFALESYDPRGQDALVKLLARVSVGSWWIDRFVSDQTFDIAGSGKFAPLIPIRGPSQSGKNRLAFVLRLLCYRPYFEMSTNKIPSLYRPLDLWQGTLILDEADFANTNEQSELVHFLNCRATGTPLSRQNPTNANQTDTFANFGLTILTQRKAFDDNATESRSIPYYSEVSDKKIPVLETDSMIKEGLALQNKLLYLRMTYYQQVVINKESWIEDLIDHRLIASLLPLLALSKYEPTLKTSITDTAKAIQRAKIEEKAGSMDGLIINYLWEKIDAGLFSQWQPGKYYFLDSAEIDEEQGTEALETKPLTTKTIEEHFRWSSQCIRKTLNSLNIAGKGLPAFIKVKGKTHRVIFFEADKIEKRLREFVVDYQPNSTNGKISVTKVTLVTANTCEANTGGQQTIG